MDRVIQEALEHYNIKNPEPSFIRHNENLTYKLTDGADAYLLRIHKPVKGFSLGIYQRNSDPVKSLQSEMLLIDYARNHMKKAMQKPVRNRFGEFVSCLSGGTPVTLLKWIEGTTIGEIDITEEIGEAIGAMAAELHHCFHELQIDPENHSFSSRLNCEINRYAYDQKLLDRVIEELNRGVRSGQLKEKRVNTMKEALGVIRGRMDELEKIPGMSGIVHADLSPSNLILSDQQIVPIDFSLSGYGFYYMDLGMLLSQWKDHSIRRSIKRGYEKIIKKEVPLEYIEPFFALGVLLFIACQRDKIYREDWFEAALERWEKGIFCPLINDDHFVFETPMERVMKDDKEVQE